MWSTTAFNPRGRIAAIDTLEKARGGAFRVPAERLLTWYDLDHAKLRSAVAEKKVAREQSRAVDGAIVGLLSDHLYYGRDMAFEAQRDAAYQALTVEQVNAAIRKHLKPERLSVFVAGDFK